MNEAESLGMESLAWANLETVFHELLVFGELCAAQNLLATIALVVEEYMAHVLHVCTDLVSAPRFENTLHETHVGETLQNILVGDGMFTNS